MRPGVEFLSTGFRRGLNRGKTRHFWLFPGPQPAFAKIRAVQASVCYRGRFGLSTDSHGGSSPVTLMHPLPRQVMWSDFSDGGLAFAGSPPRRDPLWRVSRSRSRGLCLFSSANSAVWRQMDLWHGRARRSSVVGPDGLSTCGGVVEGVVVPSAISRPCGSGKLGGTGVLHRLSPPSLPVRLCLAAPRAD